MKNSKTLNTNYIKAGIGAVCISALISFIGIIFNALELDAELNNNTVQFMFIVFCGICHIIQWEIIKRIMTVILNENKIIVPINILQILIAVVIIPDSLMLFDENNMLVYAYALSALELFKEVMMVIIFIKILKISTDSINLSSLKLFAWSEILILLFYFIHNILIQITGINIPYEYYGFIGFIPQVFIIVFFLTVIKSIKAEPQH